MTPEQFKMLQSLQDRCLTNACAFIFGGWLLFIMTVIILDKVL